MPAIRTYQEHELLAYITKGNRQAFDQLFLEMYTPLFILAHRLTGDEEPAKDIVSDCFLHLWLNRASLTKVKDIRAYLYTVTRNRTLDYLKARKRSLQREEKVAEQDWFTDSSNDVLQAILDTEALRSLYDAIQTLPVECRKVVQLSMDGHSTKEIAEQLLISPSAVSHQKARAIKLLKDKVSPAFLLLFLSL